ncbi:L-lactate permease [Shigella sonnei]
MNALLVHCNRPTAQQINVSDTLLGAANTSGGVTGKIISRQSIAVACAATAWWAENLNCSATP